LDQEESLLAPQHGSVRAVPRRAMMLQSHRSRSQGHDKSQLKKTIAVRRFDLALRGGLQATIQAAPFRAPD